MTQKAFKTDYDPQSLGKMRGDLMNKFGRALNGVNHAGRVSDSATRVGPLTLQAGPQAGRWTDQLMVHNGSTSSLRQFDILQIGGLVPGQVIFNHFDLALDGEVPALPFKMFAVLMASAVPGQMVECQIDGLCPAYVNVTNTGHWRARPGANLHVLQSDAIGPCKIVWKPDAETGEKLCIVQLGTPDSIHLFAKSPVAGIPARSGSVVGSAMCGLYYIDDSDTLQEYKDDSDVQVTIPVKNLSDAAVTGSEWLQVTQDALSNKAGCTWEDC